MWQSRTKNDLIIEVWEKLDCDNVGAAEIEAIETVVSDQFGPSAIDSPMIIARLLADEGADLRHSEIMKLYVDRASDRPYDAALRNILRIDSLKNAAASLRNLENLRQKYKRENDREGLRLIRKTSLSTKQAAVALSEKKTVTTAAKQLNIEIAEWITIWMQTPEIFDTWVELRQRSSEFIEIFRNINES